MAKISDNSPGAAARIAKWSRNCHGKKTGFTRRCRVGEAAGRTCGRQANVPVIPADRDFRVAHASGMSGNGASRPFLAPNAPTENL